MRYVVCWSVLASAAFLAGCGRGEDVSGRQPVFPVSGTVKYKGRPVAGADVTFVCNEKEKSAFGRTDDNGNFQLTTYSANDGAVAGKHVVVVVKSAAAPPVTSVEPDDPNYDPIALAKTPPPRLKSEFPARYSDPKKSDLIAVVNAEGGNTEMVLELKD